jgi:hypothetical protein
VQPPPVEKKPAKKAVAAPSLPAEPLLHVQLRDTIIFPEGGGQPTDVGTLTLKADGSVWEVLQAKRHGGHAVHYVRVKGDADAAWRAFATGADVTVSLGNEGWERRYDNVRGTSPRSLVYGSPTEITFIDVDAHVPTPAICPSRNPLGCAYAVLVVDNISLALLRGGAQRFERGRNSLNPE